MKLPCFCLSMEALEACLIPAGFSSTSETGSYSVLQSSAHFCHLRHSSLDQGRRREATLQSCYHHLGCLLLISKFGACLCLYYSYELNLDLRHCQGWATSHFQSLWLLIGDLVVLLVFSLCLHSMGGLEEDILIRSRIFGASSVIIISPLPSFCSQGKPEMEFYMCLVLGLESWELVTESSLDSMVHLGWLCLLCIGHSKQIECCLLAVATTLTGSGFVTLVEKPNLLRWILAHSFCVAGIREYATTDLVCGHFETQIQLGLLHLWRGVHYLRFFEWSAGRGETLRLLLICPLALVLWE